MRQKRKGKAVLCRQRLQISSLADDLFQIQKTYSGYNSPAFDSESFMPRESFPLILRLTRDRNSEFRIPNSEL